jgi:RNA polymerase-associated protein CTR9
MYLWKCREAPRLAREGVLVSEAKTKEYYLQLAVSTLNDASRINPSFPPLFLARGVLYLLRASLQAPSKARAASGASVDSEKADLLRRALESFEDAIRVSRGKNMLAVMGKSRVLFSLGKYSEALAGYQEVLAKMPDFIDPDPRVGIGYCLWKLGFKEDAKVAWERSLEINHKSKIATVLIGLYYLDASSSIPIESPDFIRIYKKAITEYIQKSFKLDSNFPLAQHSPATFCRGNRSQILILYLIKQFNTQISMLLQVMAGIYLGGKSITQAISTEQATAIDAQMMLVGAPKVAISLRSSAQPNYLSFRTTLGKPNCAWRRWSSILETTKPQPF